MSGDVFLMVLVLLLCLDDVKNDEHRLLTLDLGPGVTKLLFSLSSSSWRGVTGESSLCLFSG